MHNKANSNEVLIPIQICYLLSFGNRQWLVSLRFPRFRWNTGTVFRKVELRASFSWVFWELCVSWIVCCVFFCVVPDLMGGCAVGLLGRMLGVDNGGDQY